MTIVGVLKQFYFSIDSSLLFDFKTVCKNIYNILNVKVMDAISLKVKVES